METTALTRSSDEETLVRARPVAMSVSGRIVAARLSLEPVPAAAISAVRAILPSSTQLGASSALARAAELAALAVEGAILVRGEEILSQPALAERFAALTDAAATLAEHPDGFEARVHLVEKADELATAIRSAARSLAILGRNVRSRILEQVARANALLATAAASEAREELSDRGMPPFLAIRELAGLLGMSLASTSDGATALCARGGGELLAGRRAARLEIVGLGDGERAEILVQQRDCGSSERMSRPVGGAIGALLELQGSDLPNWSADLERFATALRDGANEAHAHARARDLDGYGAGDLFCGDVAADLTVAVAGARGVSAGRGPDAPEASARALAELGERRLSCLHGATIREFIHGLSSRPGIRRAAALQAMSPGGEVSDPPKHRGRRG